MVNYVITLRILRGGAYPIEFRGALIIITRVLLGWRWGRFNTDTGRMGR
jgi:hypothetical protein